MSADRDAVTNSTQSWVEVINSSTPTKEEVMHDENTPKMSKETADTVFGPGGSLGIAPSDFDRDLYELRKLADQVLVAVEAKRAQELAFDGAGGALPYNRPKLEFTLPMPVWEEV